MFQEDHISLFFFVSPSMIVNINKERFARDLVVVWWLYEDQDSGFP